MDEDEINFKINEEIERKLGPEGIAKIEKLTTQMVMLRKAMGVTQAEINNFDDSKEITDGNVIKKFKRVIKKLSRQKNEFVKITQQATELIASVN